MKLVILLVRSDFAVAELGRIYLNCDLIFTVISFIIIIMS
jgi:hypothetical protein